MVDSVLALSPGELASQTLAPDSARRAHALLAEHGFVSLPALLGTDAIEAVRATYFARLGDGPAGGPGVEVCARRFMIPVELAPPFSDRGLVANPLLLQIMKAELGDDLVLNSFVSVLSLPGAGAQVRHKDHGDLFGWSVDPLLPCHAMTLVIPLIDLDETTGTTALYEGTHRPNADERPPSLPYLPRGGCFLMDYRLSHHGTANLGTAARPILYIVYSRPWFLDERNFYNLEPVSMSDAVYAALTPGERALFARARIPGVEIVP